jgi:hypothetical protein
MPFEKEISELFSFSRGFHICLDEALSRSPAMRREFLSDFAFSSSDFLCPVECEAYSTGVYSAPRTSSRV